MRDPITCWSPVHFTKAHVEFVTSYCWVKDTYYLPWSKPIPKYASDPRQMIPYYQWIPFILLFQVSSSSTVLVSYLSKDFTDHCKDPGGASGPLSAEFDIFLLGRGRKYRGSAGRTSPVGSKGKTPVGGLGDKVLKWGTKSPRN